MIKTPISDCYETARRILKQTENNSNELEVQRLKNEARDKADEGLVLLATSVIKHKLKDEDIIEAVKVRLWYDRFWLFLELNGLMLDDDKDHKPEDNYFWDKMAGVEL